MLHQQGSVKMSESVPLSLKFSCSGFQEPFAPEPRHGKF